MPISSAPLLQATVREEEGRRGSEAERREGEGRRRGVKQRRGEGEGSRRRGR